MFLPNLAQPLVGQLPTGTDPLSIIPDVYAVEFKPKKGIRMVAYIRNGQCDEIEYFWTAASTGSPALAQLGDFKTVTGALKEINAGGSSWSGRMHFDCSSPFEDPELAEEFITEVRDDCAAAMGVFPDGDSVQAVFWSPKWKKFLADFDRRRKAKKDDIEKKRASDFARDF